eukprot:CAMPEP_0183791088 /NCGR_PEP_ID=MMETSP0803_2-20130417/1597_1 /TAXON_ID=195967 /ORGANISM="Crustomastix stigmata, Strain CCMP3273" /LENGTH=125 /DNA_ID=CAMNT_0026035377 /DNA_START=73 /DNA_END=450 /DNA_ORIENTATION=-
MPMTVLDKVAIGLMAPYAAGMLADPATTFKPIAPGMTDTPGKKRMVRMMGGMTSYIVASKFATKDADKKTKRKMNAVFGATILGFVPLIAQMDQEEDKAVKGMQMFNCASNIVMGGLHLKAAMQD